MKHGMNTDWPEPEECNSFRVERPTWPFSAATCRRARACEFPHQTVDDGDGEECRAGRPPQRAGGPFHHPRLHGPVARATLNTDCMVPAEDASQFIGTIGPECGGMIPRDPGNSGGWFRSPSPRGEGRDENSPNQSSRFEPQNRKPSEVDGLALRGHALAARAHPPGTVHGEGKESALQVEFDTGWSEWISRSPSPSPSPAGRGNTKYQCLIYSHHRLRHRLGFILFIGPSDIGVVVAGELLRHSPTSLYGRTHH